MLQEHLGTEYEITSTVELSYDIMKRTEYFVLL
jgi:hypothetical protein